MDRKQSAIALKSIAANCVACNAVFLGTEIAILFETSGLRAKRAVWLLLDTEVKSRSI